MTVNVEKQIFKNPENMKDKIPRIVILPIVLILISTCSLIEGIFEAGIGVVVFLATIILTVIAFVVSKIIKRHKNPLLHSKIFNS